MKRMIIMLFALFVMNSANTQPCLPEGITFSSQLQINNFRTNFPGCTQIGGDLIISGYNITNLNGLSSITSIGGSLMVECNESLASLTGLDNVTYIGGDLYCEGNMLITNLAGLGKVSYIGGDVMFTDNVALTSLIGLQGITAIGGMLWIDYNDALINLAGLTNVVSIAGFVRISANNSLLNFTGLDNLASIGGSLVIGGMEHLGGIGNPSLVSLTSLQNLTSIGGNMDIGYNNSLVSLAGLDNIAAGSILNLSIYNNSILSACEVQSVCDYLANPGGEVFISENAPGCNGVDEVEAACILTSIDKPILSGEVSLYPNPTTGIVNIEIPDLMDQGMITLTTLNGFESVKYQFTGSFARVDMSDLPGGIYVIRITNERMGWIGKIVKQ